MYAAVMYLRFDPQLAPLAASAFVDKLLPRVKAAAGFGEGTWLDPSDGEGLGFKLFDPQEQAHEAVTRLLPCCGTNMHGIAHIIRTVVG